LLEGEAKAKRLEKPHWYIIPLSKHHNIYGPYKRKKDAIAYQEKWCVPGTTAILKMVRV
jgi:hypothetical protein